MVVPPPVCTAPVADIDTAVPKTTGDTEGDTTGDATGEILGVLVLKVPTAAGGD